MNTIFSKNNYVSKALAKIKLVTPKVNHYTLHSPFNLEGFKSWLNKHVIPHHQLVLKDRLEFLERPPAGEGGSSPIKH
jgi:hypothetical protein